MANAAFFDLDNTLIHGSSMFHLARIAVRRGLVSRRDLARFTLCELRYVITREEGERDRNRLMQHALSLVAGRPEAEVRALGEAVAERLATHHLVAVTLRQLRLLQERHYECWMVTASAREIAEPLARRLGMAGAAATRAEIVAGRYTGQLSGPIMHGQAKAIAVLGIALEHSYDLNRAFAYSDSRSDVPMLLEVGNVAVVNASRRFESDAKARGWTVLRVFHRKQLGARRAQPLWSDVLRLENCISEVRRLPRRGHHPVPVLH